MAQNTVAPAGSELEVSSFAKGLALGEIHEDMVFPYPIPRDEEAAKVRELLRRFRDCAAQHIDSRRIDDERWIEDHVFTDLGELGLTGLYVPERYGGQGLSQTGYARVFEAFGQADGSLTVALGAHQSIGMKGIVLFGSDEQKERLLPDLAAGRRLAGFALTEPEAGSHASGIRSRAVRQADGSWVLNGEKRWIGNGGRGEVFVTFARAELADGRDSHVALILEKGMEGFEAGEPYDTMGLRGNYLTPLSFRDVRVPAENVLGEPGEGFRIAMEILNNGRLSISPTPSASAGPTPATWPDASSAACVPTACAVPTASSRASRGRWATRSRGCESVGEGLLRRHGKGSSTMACTTSAWPPR